METNEPQLWEELYTAAVLETDPRKVAARIDEAQTALRERLHTRCQLPLAHCRERQRLEDAIRTWNMIRATGLEAPL